MKKVLAACLPMLAILSGITPAAADEFKGYPNFRIENYASNFVAVWTSAVPCGELEFDGSATDEVKDRFWSLVLTAKIANRPIGIYYNQSNSHCYISSFYIDS
jgi:hypothetical protein